MFIEIGHHNNVYPAGMENKNTLQKAKSMIDEPERPKVDNERGGKGITKIAALNALMISNSSRVNLMSVLTKSPVNGGNYENKALTDTK